jgi:predicted HAD superfamily Cof-like phosphohydrolase
MHYQNKVKEFMKVFGQDCPDIPTIPDINTRILRVKLLLEEVLELAEASGVEIIDTFNAPLDTSSIKTNKIKFKEIENSTTSLVGVADALADISYVNYGAANAYGINIEPIEEEVHRSNMTKLFSSDEISKLDQNNFKITKIRDNQFLVKSLDGKVQKSPSYSPADIDTLLTK